MTIQTIHAAKEKKEITRIILEALPDWFGIPEAREDYINKSTDNLFFAAFEGEDPVGFLNCM